MGKGNGDGGRGAKTSVGKADVEGTINLETSEKGTIYSTAEAADRELRPMTEDAWAKMTEDEKWALTDYTGAWEGYLDINEAARLGKGTKDAMDQVKLVENAIDKAPRLDKTRYVTRYIDENSNTIGINDGMGLNELKAMVGKTFVKKDFTSTGLVKQEGVPAYEASYGEYRYGLRIKLPKGTKGIYAGPFSQYGSGERMDSGQGSLWNGKSKGKSLGKESEFIVQRNSTFKITGVKQTLDGKRFLIDVELIKQKK